MNKIISKEHFSEKGFKLVIEAPLIAKSRKAGHFVIVRVGEKGERMPTYEVLLQIANYFDVSVDYLMCRTDHPKINR